MKHFFKRLFTTIIIIAVSYSFLSLCNWALSVAEWNGFSRFILGCIGIVGIFNCFDVRIK